MAKIANLIIKGSKALPIGTDIFYTPGQTQQPVVVFCHGFKGFKDWGHFDLIGEAFAQQGFVFIKFNFSHNGTTPDHPSEFADLQSFGANNYSTELDDLGLVIDYAEQHAAEYGGDARKIYLIGHSRGGGISILKTKEDPRIKKLVTWASIKDFQDFFKAMDLEHWKEEGTTYTFNARTQQQMPLGYQLYEDYLQHHERLDIPQAAAAIAVPWLIVHGEKDGAVPVSAAKQLHAWNHNSQLLLIAEGDHTFGGKHPWTSKELPEAATVVVAETLHFFAA
jgi:dienelactone hydrolase